MTTMTNRIARSVPPGPSVAAALYTAELAETILEQLMEGRTLPDVCRDDGMPAAETVRRWVLDDREGFAARYLRARRIGTVAIASQAFEIAADALGAWSTHRGKGGGAEVTPDLEHIARSLVRIEARCWLLASFLPRIYRDGLDPGF
jgi:hypothetical protein